MDSKSNSAKAKRLKSAFKISIDPKDVERRPRSPIKPSKVEKGPKTYSRKPKHVKKTLWSILILALWSGSCAQKPDRSVQLEPDGLWSYRYTLSMWSDGRERTLSIPLQLDWAQVRAKADAPQWSLSATSEDEFVQLRLVASRESAQPWISFRLDIDVKASYAVLAETLRWQMPSVQGLRFVSRKYEWEAYPATFEKVFVDRATPWRVQWIGDDRVPRMFAMAGFPRGRAPGMWVSRSGSIDLELDHELNRPVGTFGARSQRRISGQRAIGENARYEWRIYFSNPPLELPERFPGGARAAIVVTDHADQSSYLKTKTIVDAFTERKLALTKTVFGAKSSGYSRQLDDGRFKQLMLSLQSAGSEIGLHSWTGGSDRSEVLLNGLDQFRKSFHGKVWIDHQPDTNLEALSNEGWRKDSPYFAVDALRKHGVGYVWNAKDVSLSKDPLNLWRPSEPDQRVITYFEDTLYPGLTFFTTQWAYWTPRKWERKFSPENIEQFIRDRGLWMGHTYLDTAQDHGPHEGLSLLIKSADPNTRYTLHAEFFRTLDRWERAQRNGQLSVTTVSSVLDHLRSNESEWPKISTKDRGREDILFRTESVE